MESQHIFRNTIGTFPAAHSHLGVKGSSAVHLDP